MRLPAFVAALSFAAVLGCTVAPTMSTDGTIFTAKTIALSAQQTPQHDAAVFVRDGKIVATGTLSELRSAHPNANVVDYGDATILPGLTDAHAHLYGLGLSLDTVKLVGATSVDEVLARMKPRAAHAAPGEWVLGRGWDQNRWPVKQFPTAAMIDAVISDHPVWLKRVDGHA